MQGILLVCDVTDRGSFNSTRSWMGTIQRQADLYVDRILVTSAMSDGTTILTCRFVLI